MAALTDIADAVTDELHAVAWSLPLAAVRAYAPSYALADLATLRVTVVPEGEDLLPGSRSADQFDYRVQIVVQQRLTAVENADLDPLADLVEEILDHFRGRRLPGYAAALCVGAGIDPVCSPEAVTQLREFFSVVTLTYRAHR